jgi:hypothetical protein
MVVFLAFQDPLPKKLWLLLGTDGYMSEQRGHSGTVYMCTNGLCFGELSAYEQDPQNIRGAPTFPGFRMGN